MEKNEMYQLMNTNPACHIATVENGEPRVRGILIFKADDSGIVFHSSSIKELHKQLVENPSTEICFNDFQAQVQLRVRGKVEVVKDKTLEDEITSHPTRAFLKSWEGIEGAGELTVYRLVKGEATTWGMDSNFVYPKPAVVLN